MLEKIILASVDLENILDNPLGSALNEYSKVFAPFPEIFFALAFLAVPTVVVAMKTDDVAPPLIVLILGSFMVGSFVGQFGRYFIIFAGILFGILLFKLAKEVR